MTRPLRDDALEIHRKSQELAVAWRRGRAAFVLDSLEAEEPLRAALIATLVHEALARWDPLDSKWPDGFRFALLARSRGAVTPNEWTELEREYSRRFGSRPPLPRLQGDVDPTQAARFMNLQVARIREAIASGRPLVREQPAPESPRFLRPQPARP